MAIRKKAAELLTGGKNRRRRRMRLEDRRDIALRSEGQRLLLEVEGLIEGIQTSCGVSHQTVIDWRYGRKVPGPSARAALWNAYEIPAASWGRLPAGTQPASAPESAAPTNGHAVPPEPTNGHAVPPAALAPASPTNGHVSAPSSLDETATLLGQIRQQLTATDLLPSDRVRITDSYTRTLALQHRLQREADMSEDRIVREHPTWRRIRTELARVLARYPAIADEVCAALDRLGV